MVDQPAPPKMFSISCSFSENLVKSYVGAPRRIGGPSYGESWIRPWWAWHPEREETMWDLITSLCVEIPSLKENQFSSWTVFCSPNFCCTRRLSFACKVVFSFNFAPNELSAHYADDSITVNYRLFTVQFLFASVSPAQFDLQITCYQRIKVAFSPLSPRLHCITLIMNLLIFFLMSQYQESQLLPTWCV